MRHRVFVTQFRQTKQYIFESWLLEKSLTSRELIEHEVIRNDKFPCLDNDARVVSPTLANVLRKKTTTTACHAAGTQERRALYLIQKYEFAPNQSVTSWIYLYKAHFFRITLRLSAFAIYCSFFFSTKERSNRMVPACFFFVCLFFGFVFFWPYESSVFPFHLRLAEKSCFGLAELLSPSDTLR